MTGSTHRFVGTVVGAAIVIYAVGTKQPMFALGMATAPFGAMLPDIDHDRTQLGSARKSVSAVCTKVAVAVTACSVVATILVGYFSGALLPVLLKSLLYILPPCIVILIANNEKMRDKHPFLYKHRGIMHTMVIPYVLWVGYLLIDNEVIKPLLLGLVLGYMSHLYLDCLTVSGCPLSWPVTEDVVRITRIRTGSAGEYIGAAVFSIVIVGFGLLVTKDSSYFKWILLPLLYGLGPAVTTLLFRILPNKYKSIAYSQFLPLGIFAIAFLCRKTEYAGIIILSLGLGILGRRVQNVSLFGIENSRR